MRNPFGSPSEILDARTAWTHAVLAAELTSGRQRGYVVGTDLDQRVAPSAARERITARLALLPLECSPMGQLRAAFALSDVEEDVLWLLACCEIDPCLSKIVELIASSGMTQLSVQHVERLTGASARALERLATWGLVEVERDPRLPIHRRRIRIDDRVLELLRGNLGAALLLDGIADLTGPSDALVPPEIAQAMLGGGSVLAIAVGSEGSDREVVLRASAPGPFLVVACDALATEREHLNRQLRAIAREARLFGATALFAGADQLMDDDLFEREILAKARGPVLATVTRLPETITASDRPMVIHTVTAPDVDARRHAWHAHLSGAPDAVLDACADRYRLPTALLAQTARAVLMTVADPANIAIADVQAALRERLDRKLSGFARRIEWSQSWDDLVLPDDQMELLVELIARTRHRQRVLTEWGFAAKVGKGFGVSALFSGPPGTGKTMIAGLVARELGLDLYQVDLSKIVSKYIGETEKQLAALFDAAEHGQAIILFDEADSLFGKRTEVKSSNDRYANLETNYLLQRLESFDGICLLTTNHETSIDEAFMRRLSLHIRVPMPDEEHREKLWQAMLPAAAAVEGKLAFAELAQDFVMSGGYIKNAVVRAAYLAAAEHGAIAIGHLERAARAEYEAMGKVTYQSRAGAS